MKKDWTNLARHAQPDHQAPAQLRQRLEQPGAGTSPTTSRSSSTTTASATAGSSRASTSSRRASSYNEREPRLLWDIGWIISQKIGRADEHKQFRKLFKEDDDFHGSRPLAQRDNWLVGKEWFERGRGHGRHRRASMMGTSPLIFRSNGPMCQMNYAEALEKDGTFGESGQDGSGSGPARNGTITANSISRPSEGRAIRLGQLDRLDRPD